MLKSLGATAVVDYKKPEPDQIAEILHFTEGKATRIFDAVATNQDFAKKVFKEVDAEPKYFSSTNDW